jgi:hypothetical protein
VPGRAKAVRDYSKATPIRYCLRRLSQFLEGLMNIKDATVHAAGERHHSQFDDLVTG